MAAVIILEGWVAFYRAKAAAEEFVCVLCLNDYTRRSLK